MKIEKVFLKVILAILIIFIFFVYRVTLFIPQKINLENIKPIQINEKFEIIDISKNEKMIGSKIDVNYIKCFRKCFRKQQDYCHYYSTN